MEGQDDAGGLDEEHAEGQGLEGPGYPPGRQVAGVVEEEAQQKELDRPQRDAGDRLKGGQPGGVELKCVERLKSYSDISPLPRAASQKGGAAHCPTAVAVPALHFLTLEGSVLLTCPPSLYPRKVGCPHLPSMSLL